jgi:uncharacterized protein
MVLVAIGFGLQHITFAPTLLGGISFIIAFFLWGLGASIIYSRQRRLTSLILAHYLSNVMVTLAILVLVTLQ